MTRPDRTDAAFLASLSMLALLGFWHTFDSWPFLAAGVAGLLLGLGVAHLGRAYRLPVVVVIALVIAVFVLFGGAVALPDSTLARVVPTVATVHDLAAEAVRGWKNLLTAQPPADTSGPELVLPYLLGLLAGASGLTLATRLRAALPPVLVPTATLAVVLLLGTGELPLWQGIHGLLFPAVALCWAAVRARRRRPAALSGTHQLSRVGAAVALLAVSAGAALLIGPRLASPHRTVLRDYVAPPFDISAYQSPLGKFRTFVKDSPHSSYSTPLFTVTGALPADSWLRLATLTSYDGSVWSAVPDTGDPADAFQRVGRTINQPAAGTRISYQVTVSGYTDVWLPAAGQLAGIRFSGPDSTALQDTIRYDLATGTGVVPARLHRDDGYAVQAVLPRLVPDLPPAQGAVVDAGLVSAVGPKATAWAGQATDPWARIGAVAKMLRAGAYSDGVSAQERQFLPGHSAWWLTTFLNSAQLVGNDEQYAAAFALLINQLGYPARVVLGAQLPSGGVVRGQDVHAFVEVRRTDGSWWPLHPEVFLPDRNHHPDLRQQPPPPQPRTGTVPPPPAAHPPGTVLAGAPSDTRVQDQPGNRGTHRFHLPAWVLAVLRWTAPPLLAALAWCAAVIGAKAYRRQRRRTRGPAAARIGGGWREVVDHARDLGVRIPPRLTRQEQAALLAAAAPDAPQVSALAEATDALIFGPGALTEPDAAAYWQRIPAARAALRAHTGRAARIRAALTLTSLLPPRRPPTQSIVDSPDRTPTRGGSPDPAPREGVPA
jgi:hypothetical protein